MGQCPQRHFEGQSTVPGRAQRGAARARAVEVGHAHLPHFRAGRFSTTSPAAPNRAWRLAGPARLANPARHDPDPVVTPLPAPARRTPCLHAKAASAEDQYRGPELRHGPKTARPARQAEDARPQPAKGSGAARPHPCREAPPGNEGRSTMPHVSLRPAWQSARNRSPDCGLASTPLHPRRDDAGPDA